MDQDEVRRLEDACEQALAEVLKRHFKEHPLSGRTGHLMAKAAVAVLEAVLEEE